MSAFAVLHDELRAVARELLGKSAAPGWQVQADAGWLGLEVAEASGGAGATFAEAAVVLEERGRAVTAGPWLGTAVLGVGALNLLPVGPERDELLDAIAGGRRRVSVALPTGNDPTIAFRVEDGRLHGRTEFVPDAPDADEVLVVAMDGEDPVVVRCRPEVVAQPVLDATRCFGVVTADAVAIDHVWRFEEAQPVARLRERAAVAVAADSLGSARAMLEATVAYAKVRHQFGRPIGSFQAVKHACADMLVQVTVGRELLAAAVRQADPQSAARAKAHVTASAVEVVGKALQLHGGIGYTWESGIHVHLKRVMLNRELFAGPAAHRRVLAGAIRGKYSSERSLF